MTTPAPAPYKVRENGIYSGFKGKQYRIAGVGNPAFTKEANAATAILIAAAPDLLEALINLVDQAQEDTPVHYRSKHFDAAIEDALNIINKARGNKK